MRHHTAKTIAAVCIVALSACSPDARTPTSSARPSARVSSPLLAGEGELLGDVFVNGSEIVDSSYTVELEPRNSQTSNRLHYFSESMWVSPTRHKVNNQGGAGWMFSWIDPRHQGTCGTESEYVSGDTASRGAEVHWPNRTTQPSGKEKHCIQPGNYHLTIYHNGSIYKELDVDYVPVCCSQTSDLWILDQTAGVYEEVEAKSYDDTTYMHHDFIIRTDVGTPGYSDTPVLYGDTVVGTDPNVSQSFADRASLSGDHHTWFRFSSVASTTTEGNDVGRLSSRIYWDSASDLSDRTGFWDSHSWNGVLRIHQFMTDTLNTRAYVVGLETMRSDEQPRTTPDVTRIVQIQGPPPPPFDSVSVWGPQHVKPNQTTCEWGIQAYGGVRPFAYQWYQYTGVKWLPIGSSQYLDLVVGTTNLTLKGQATDSLSRTQYQIVTVTVNSSGITCYLAPGHGR